MGCRAWLESELEACAVLVDVASVGNIIVFFKASMVRYAEQMVRRTTWSFFGLRLRDSFESRLKMYYEMLPRLYQFPTWSAWKSRWMCARMTCGRLRNFNTRTCVASSSSVLSTRSHIIPFLMETEIWPRYTRYLRVLDHRRPDYPGPSLALKSLERLCPLHRVPDDMNRGGATCSTVRSRLSQFLPHGLRTGSRFRLRRR